MCLNLLSPPHSKSQLVQSVFGCAGVEAASGRGCCLAVLLTSKANSGKHGVYY